MSQLPTSIFSFLNELKQNNDRDWFNENKARFLVQQDIIINFADKLLAKLNLHDVIETPSGKKSVYRIYRDIRFSHDKTPFKNYWSGSFTRATSQRRGGYYFHLESGNSYIVGGFQAPNTADITRIRKAISFDPSELQEILNHPSFIKTFKKLEGEQLKTTPKGFDANDPAIELLRFKQFRLVRRFSDEEVLSDDFLEKADEALRNMRPFFDYMSEVLYEDGR
ncbi:DUF2461 domain-containing protein [Flavobacterium sp. 3HN19-14]|uniref:DUF2461 domain-containing protein n=1 Tax=Flavobacterium sp. 3HN19-14 TaxID=3448133 RepID=UPI003EE26F17